MENIKKKFKSLLKQFSLNFQCKNCHELFFENSLINSILFIKNYKFFYIIENNSNNKENYEQFIQSVIISEIISKDIDNYFNNNNIKFNIIYCKNCNKIIGYKIIKVDLIYKNFINKILIRNDCLDCYYEDDLYFNKINIYKILKIKELNLNIYYELYKNKIDNHINYKEQFKLLLQSQNILNNKNFLYEKYSKIKDYLDYLEYEANIKDLENKTNKNI